ncbi:VOC family protein [Dactylosporangium sp. NPDC051484]|uniref:VOC family protein n=1 Tax=Dactylosporangium sp. NPDC051484 TaxID=3154942 RepID=UPI00344ED715
MRLDLVAIVVAAHDPAIEFFVSVLGFELVEDSPSVTSVGGRAKRWVVVRPPGGGAGLLLARADGERQLAGVGEQAAGRVEDFEAAYARMLEHGVAFEGLPRVEDYGKIVVFRDIAGNRWDLLGPS